MTYDPTLDDALARAKEILARGDSTAVGGGYPVIWDDDRFDAHLLLARFVAEIERLRAENAPPQQPDEQVLITRYRALPERGRAALRQLLDAWQ
jgi:hypothetical protein